MPAATPSANSLAQRLGSASFGAFAALGASLGFSAAVVAGMMVGGTSPPGSELDIATAHVGNAPGPPTRSEPVAPVNGGTSHDSSADDGARAADPESPRGSAAADGRPEAEATADLDEKAALGDERSEPEVVDAERDESAAEAAPAPPPAQAERNRGDDAPAPAPVSTVDRSEEAKMNATELYEAAKAAYDGGDPREAYRLATRSYRARKSDRTQVLRGKAACKTKNRDTAKDIVKSFKLRDPQRKTLRAFCKKQGVSVGL